MALPDITAAQVPPQPSSRTSKPKLCMVIFNEVFQDGRVMRAARSAQEKYELTVVGIDRRHRDFDRRTERDKLGFDVQWAPLAWSTKLKRGQLGYAARYAEALMRTTQLCLRLRPDIMHVHEDSALPVGVMVKAITGAKLIYDAHELYRDSQPYVRLLWHKINGLLETGLMKFCDGIIACNRQRAQIMFREYGAPYLPTVISNMPMARQFTPSRYLTEYVTSRNPALKHVCLHQGSIQPSRGLEVTVEALSHLPADVALVLVGGGPEDYLNKIREVGTSLGVGDRLFIHPAVQEDQLFPITCSAQIGIVIYQNVCRNNYYCAPNKLYEYAAAGLPTVGANMPPISEFLAYYRSGEVFEPQDGASLARAIEKILASREGWQTYRNCGFAAAKENCWELESRKLLELYQRVLTGCRE